MIVSLTPELERFIRSKIESGEYDDVGEVVRAALRGMMRRDGSEPEVAPTTGLAEAAPRYATRNQIVAGAAIPAVTKAEARRLEVNERKFERLRAAIQEGLDSPDDPDFSFDKLRASLEPDQTDAETLAR